MLKKTIKYTNFNGEEVTEDFYFNLSKSELVKMELSANGGLKEKIEKIVKSGDGKAIIEEFNDIILKCVGKRSDDGTRFTKTDEIRADFEASGAYDVFFLEIVTNADAAAEFIKAVVPADLAEEAAQIAAVRETPTTEEIDAEISDGSITTVTSEMVRAMTPKEFEDFSVQLAAGKARIVG